MRVSNSVSYFSVGGGEPLLREGAKGPSVTTLQTKLKALGFNVSVDGAFGPGTLAAVQAFQRSRGLSADGVVGPNTWGALDRSGATPKPTVAPAPSGGGSHPTLSMGASGSAVTEMQKDLTAAGFSTSGTDGKFGPNTLAALKRFQAAHGLTADGVCGPKSWAALTSGASFTPAPAPAPSAGTPVLREGASGAAVIQLQTLLNKAGMGVSVDGQFGPNTESAVIRYQSSRGLSADGIVGPNTWAALQRGAGAVAGTGPVAGPTGGDSLRQQILNVAESQIGTLEYGNNSGPCTKYPNYFGRGTESWCADFVSWVYTHAGDAMNDPWCPGIEQTAKSDGKWKGRSNPQPGDRVLFDWNGDGVADHVGIVKGVNSDGSIETIEGNSDKPGTSQSGVWEHTRYMSTILGFINP
jgi:peptidoglycan hydrolase-like protein with peptidoglycan-binding domain